MVNRWNICCWVVWSFRERFRGFLGLGTGGSRCRVLGFPGSRASSYVAEVEKGSRFCIRFKKIRLGSSLGTFIRYCGTYPDIQEIHDAESLERELDLPWFPDLSHSAMPLAAKKLVVKGSRDCAAGNTSNLIYSYVVGIQFSGEDLLMNAAGNFLKSTITGGTSAFHAVCFFVKVVHNCLMGTAISSSSSSMNVEDVISKFKNLHTKLEVTPSSVSYEKLIIYCCDSLKVHVALELVDEMSEQGLTFSWRHYTPFYKLVVRVVTLIWFIPLPVTGCLLVHQIYSVISRGNLKPNSETFRSMINLCVKMKDYEGAYSMLSDLEKMNLTPTAAMYNAIMVGYFREEHLQSDEEALSRLLLLLETLNDPNYWLDGCLRTILYCVRYKHLRMYQALLAAGDRKAAKVLGRKIPKDDPHVRSIIESSTISAAFTSNSLDPNSRPIKPSNFSRKSAMTYPTGFSSGISLVLFQPISKLGGSGFSRPVEDFLSRVISDFLRFSIGNFSALVVVSRV
ncbi:hypothetical protein J5N97_000391 [Dioscorea zingiberensis]|uniref:PROP1-like PPR domain-containing protein n=1 Tax=Dioscorea zingiberensis TaxID=325984 RepID=A0A9D5BSQ6_9LILI|nr:hypothetical protein J5N97_000391 [Dioscorea zingiberensis]